jgi:hypothetical protein
MDKELRVFNYRSVPTSVTADSVPTLIPEAALNALISGDDDPFYKVESIEYPIEGTGGIYTEKFFESFASVMNERPIPGTKRGHTFDSRPASDLYTIGARLDKNGDGTGKIHFKIYIPKNGDSDSNAGLIRDAKANIVHFSLVTWPEMDLQKDAKGNIITYFTGSQGYERNDAVEHGAGAMKQTVNSSEIKTIRDFERALREAGYSRRQAVAIASKGFNAAKIEDKETPMDKESVMEWIKENAGEVDLGSIAKAIGKEDHIKDNAAMQSLIQENKSLKDQLDQVSVERRKNRLDSEFGLTGDLRHYAQQLLGNASIDTLDEKIEAFKLDPVAKKLSGERADVWSAQNAILEKDIKKVSVLDSFR